MSFRSKATVLAMLMIGVGLSRGVEELRETRGRGGKGSIAEKVIIN